MKVTGSATLVAPPEAIWAALRDPGLLVRAIPGCERLDVMRSGAARLTMATAMTAVRGTYDGEIRVADLRATEFLELKASAAGSPGTVSADVRVQFAPAGEAATQLSYEVDAMIDGAIASVGQRMLSSIVKRLADEFFASVDELLAERPPANPPQPAQPAGGQAVPAAGPDVPAARQGAVAAAGAAALNQPRTGTGPVAGVEMRTGLLACAAIGLAGILIGVMLGRRRPRRDR